MQSSYEALALSSRVIAADPVTGSLLGHWCNTDHCTRGSIGFSFTMTENGELRVAAYGKCHPSWSVLVFDATPTAQGCWAKQDSGFKIEYRTFTLGQDGTLKFENEKIFNDDRGTMHSDPQTFERFEGDLVELGEYMTDKFYPGPDEGGWNEHELSTKLHDFHDIPKAIQSGALWTAARLMKLCGLTVAALAVALCGVLDSSLFGSMKWITRNPAEYIIWVIAVANLAAIMFVPDVITALGNKLRETYMAVNGNPLPFGSGSVGIQIGGVLHRLGGRVVFNLASMGTVATVAALATYSSEWSTHLQGKTHKTATRKSAPLADLASEAAALCDRAGFTPMPFTYILIKLVGVSVLQDFLFLAKENLYESLQSPLKLSGIGFTAFQTASVILTYLRVFLMAADKKFGGSAWEQYGGLIFYISQQSALISAFQLLAKMFIETNVEIDGTPPELYNAMLFSTVSVAETKYSIPRPRSTGKANIFWVCVLSILPLVLASGVTHFPIAMGYVAGAVTFPLWGSLVVLALATPVIPHDSPAAMWMQLAVETGRGAHLQVWTYGALMTCLLLVAMHARAWLWSLQAWLQGSPPSGQCGYLTSITTVFFTGVVVVFMQSFLAWAVLMYSGFDLSTIPMTEFNGRQLIAYNKCWSDLSQDLLTKLIAFTGLV